MHLSDAVKTIRVEAPAAAAQNTLTTDWVDTQGFEGIRFILGLGTLTTSASTDTIIKAQQSQDSGGSGAADLEGTSITIDEDADDNKLVIVDIWHPQERYVAVIIDPGNQNVVFDLGIAELYGAAKEPVTQDATVSHLEKHNSPAEGTA